MKKVILSLFLILGLQASEDLHKHHLDVFVGGAKESRDQDESTHVIGLEYQYRINKSWGVGASIEALGNDTHREDAYILPITYHLTPNWKLFVGPGYEDDGHHKAFLVRIGAGYEIDLGHNFNVAPRFMVDAIEGHGPTYIAGFAFGYGF